jgi:ribose-phosphate pyrophosphokinase
MKTLDLTSLDNSDIKYRIDKFPDGQQQVVIDKSNCYESDYGYILMTHEDCKVTIKSRLNNFQDLELIICATKSLRNIGVKEIHLYTPYFLGSRSDRQFEEGSNNYLKDIICPIINSLKFDSVTVLDPHSDVLEACLNNFKKDKDNQVKLVQKALSSINNHPSSVIQDKFILLSPDAGASKKIYKIAEQIGYKGDIITCSKDRDKDGKLTKTVVPDDGGILGEGRDVIIIDDICDGGATFINIAKEIKWQMATQSKIYLIVTHGIFSKGFEELSKYFDGIYCTNSYKDINDYITDPPFLVKQLNVMIKNIQSITYMKNLKN